MDFAQRGRLCAKRTSYIHIIGCDRSLLIVLIRYLYREYLCALIAGLVYHSSLHLVGAFCVHIIQQMYIS